MDITRPTPTTCVCGRVSKTRGGNNTHSRTCPVEQARINAFIKACHEGRSENAWQEGYAAARKVMAAQ